MKYRYLRIILNFALCLVLFCVCSPKNVLAQSCDTPADSMRQYYVNYLNASTETEKSDWLNQVVKVAVEVQKCSLAQDSSLVGQAFSYETAALQKNGRGDEVIYRMDDVLEKYTHLADSSTLAKLYWRFAVALSFRNDPIRAAQKYFATVPYIQTLSPYLQVSFYNNASLAFQHLNRSQEMNRFTDQAFQIAKTLDLSQPQNLGVYVKLFTIRFYGLERHIRASGIVDTLKLIQFGEEAKMLLEKPGIFTHPANLGMDLYLSLFYVAALTGRPADLAKYIVHLDRLLPKIGRNELAGRLRLDIASMYHHVKDFDKSKPYLKDALSSFLAVEDKQLGISYELYYQLGRQAEHEGDFLAAIAYYDEAIASVEADRDVLGNSNLSAHAFTSALPAFRGKVRTLLVLQNASPNDQSHIEEALKTMALARGRRFLEMQSRTYVQATIQDAVVADSLFGLLRKVQSSLADSAISRDLYQTLKQKEADIFAHPYFAKQSFSLARDWISFDEIQNKLTPNQAVLAYFVDKKDLNHTFEPRSAVFVISKDTVQVIQMKSSYNNFIRQIDTVSLLFSSTDVIPSLNARTFDKTALAELGNMLVDPVFKAIPTVKPELIIIPDAPLYAFPFAALRYKMNENTAYQYLIESHQISYGLSLQSYFAHHNQEQTATLNLLALGKSDGFSNNLTDLSYVHDEVSSIVNIIPENESYLDDDALESVLYDRGPRASIIHIASHALSDENSELNSSLFLSAHKNGPEDGTVYIHELQGRRFNADLVVLSGCGTGTGALLGGEGMVGLHYGFRAAGVQSSIATLWPVDDRSFPKLMTNFYENVSRGETVAASLQNAQIEAVKSGIDPFYWASPVLFGRVQTIPLKAASFPWFWVVIGGFVLIGAVVISRRRKTVG